MRHNPPLLSRATFAVALALSAASLVAYAGEASDSTEIQVFANGKQEKITLDDLKIGETRQVYSEAGTLVTVTRLADSIELDIAGEKTSVPMHHALGENEWGAMIEGEQTLAEAGKHVVRIHKIGEGGDHAGAHHKVIVLDKDGEGPHEIELDGAQIVMKHDGPGEKAVFVKRKVVKDAAADAATGDEK